MRRLLCVLARRHGRRAVFVGEGDCDAICGRCGQLTFIGVRCVVATRWIKAEDLPYGAADRGA